MSCENASTRIVLLYRLPSQISGVCDGRTFASPLLAVLPVCASPFCEQADAHARRSRKSTAGLALPVGLTAYRAPRERAHLGLQSSTSGHTRAILERVARKSKLPEKSADLIQKVIYDVSPSHFADNYRGQIAPVNSLPNLIGQA